MLALQIYRIPVAARSFLKDVFHFFLRLFKVMDFGFKKFILEMCILLGSFVMHHVVDKEKHFKAVGARMMSKGLPLKDFEFLTQDSIAVIS